MKQSLSEAVTEAFKIVESTQLDQTQLAALDVALEKHKFLSTLKMPEQLSAFGNNIELNVTAGVYDVKAKYPEIKFFIKYNNSKDGDKLVIDGSGTFEIGSIEHSTPSWNVSVTLNGKSVDKKLIESKLKSYIQTNLRKELVKLVKA